MDVELLAISRIERTLAGLSEDQQIRALSFIVSRANKRVADAVLHSLGLPPGLAGVRAFGSRIADDRQMEIPAGGE